MKARNFIRSILAGIASALVIAFPALGDMVIHEGANEIMLLDAPCTSQKGKLSTIPAEYRAKMKAARITWEGKKYAACWGDVGQGLLMVFDETGDGGLIPKESFTPVVGV